MTTASFCIRRYEPSDESEVVQLWKECNLVVPWNNPQNDIQTKMAYQPELFLVGTLDNQVVATAMAGYEGHRGWVNYLAVKPEKQRLGLGRKIMEAVEGKLKGLDCPKLNIQVRTSNTNVIEFYKRIGFSDDNVIGMGKRFRK